MKSLLSQLKLAYPPFTNQEGEWLWNDIEVREYVKNSKIYMIVQREELLFDDFEFIFDSPGIIKFRLKMGDILSPIIRLELGREIKYLIENDAELNVELGDRIFRVSNSYNNEIILWFTPNKFLFDYWRGKIKVEIDGDFDHKEFSKYDLHYVGISKENDSFSRLFKNAHHGRLKILSNAYPKSKKSRVTDEILLLLFDIEVTNISITPTIDLQMLENIDYKLDNDILVVADAEKAFVRLLDTEYNEVKFQMYPAGEDGLFGQELDRYVYAISEDITLLTKKGDFNCTYNPFAPHDCIYINGINATVVKHT